MLGTGKSYLSEVINDYLLRQYPSRSIVSHAFQATVSARARSPTSLAASILHSLLESGSARQAQRDAFSELERLRSRHKANPEECDFTTVWEVCIQLLRESNNFILVIDALDECVFGRPQEVQSFLESLSSLLSSTAGKAIIFTRPSCQLDVGVASDPRQSEITITPDATLEDLKNFITRFCSQIDLTRSSRLQVVEKASAGPFLWTRLFLEKISEANNQKQVNKIIRDFPPTCWGVYLKTWREHFKNSTGDSCGRETSRDIFSILLAARRPMTIKEVEESLGLVAKRGAFVMSQFCRPLVVAMDGCLYLGHASVRDFLLSEDLDMRAEGITFDRTEPDANLARMCLECLLKPKFAELDRIARRLRGNIEPDGLPDDPDSSFYPYAARHWDTHLAGVESPDRDLLELAGKFLRSLQFAHWAEYSHSGSADLQAVRETLIRLRRWNKDLPEECKKLLALEAYFEQPYTKLRHKYQVSSNDNELQWFALMQLGSYYFDTGRISEMGKIRDEVAEGLTNLLGRRHQLSLKARSDAAYAPLFKGEIRKAHQIYVEVAEDQHQVDPEGEQFFITLVYQGRAEYMMNSTSKALDTISNAMDGLLRTKGPKSTGYLMALIWYAQVSASPTTGVRPSIKALEGVCHTHEEEYGPDDAYIMTVCIFIGNLYRICGDHDKALSNIKRSVEFRRQFIPTSDLGTVDPSIFLAIAYRDAGLYEEADKVVEELETKGMLEDEDRFLRLCQVKHLRSLLLFDGGETDCAISLLQGLLIDTDREEINRALTWARVDLASMLRYRDGEGDDQAASSLFDDVVESKGEHSPGDEPNPPRVLRLAEEALRLVRSGRFDEAEELLRAEDLRWVRERDLWLNPGMPGADTTWMKPPVGLGSGAGEWVDIQPDP